MSDSCMYCGAFRNGPHFSNCPTQRGRVEKRFIFGGLIAGLLFAVGLFAHGAVAQDENYRFHVAGTLNAPDLKSLNALNTTNLFVNGKEVLSLLRAPAGSPIITVVHPDGTVDPRPLSAIVVTQCGLAVSQFTEAGSLPNTGRSSVPAGTPDTDGKVWPHPRHAHSSEAAQQGCEPPESSYRYTTPPVRGPQGRD